MLGPRGRKPTKVDCRLIAVVLDAETTTTMDKLRAETLIGARSIAASMVLGVLRSPVAIKRWREAPGKFIAQ